MGDMADFSFDSWGYWNEDAEYDGLLPEDHSDADGPPIRLITCRCCHTTGLNWQVVSGKWRLFHGNLIHDCPVNKLIAEPNKEIE